MNLNLKNKKVLITASSKGIGREIAKHFLLEKCEVIISSSSEINLEEATRQLKVSTGISPHKVKCDLNNPDEIETAINEVKRNFEGVDILINNCGGPKPGYLEHLNENDWLAGYNQVLMSAIKFIKGFLPFMISKKWGRVINITSISVKQPVENLILSNAFRSALTSATKTISENVSKHNITFNNVAPGFIFTDRLDQLANLRSIELKKDKSFILKEMADIVPVKRLGRTEDIANLVLFLSSELSSYINGTSINVDGGLNKSLF